MTEDDGWLMMMDDWRWSIFDDDGFLEDDRYVMMMDDWWWRITDDDGWLITVSFGYWML